MRTNIRCFLTVGLCLSFTLFSAQASTAQQSVDISNIGPGPNGQLATVTLGGFSNGVLPSDATTISQTQSQSGAVRQELDRRIDLARRSGNQGCAAVAAMVAALRAPSPGKSIVGLGGGYYGGQAGIAVGLAHRSQDSKWHTAATVAVPASMVSGANIAATAGVGFEF